MAATEAVVFRMLGAKELKPVSLRCFLEVSHVFWKGIASWSPNMENWKTLIYPYIQYLKKYYYQRKIIEPNGQMADFPSPCGCLPTCCGPFNHDCRGLFSPKLTRMRPDQSQDMLV